MVNKPEAVKISEKQGWLTDWSAALNLKPDYLPCSMYSGFSVFDKDEVTDTSSSSNTQLKH